MRAALTGVTAASCKVLRSPGITVSAREVCWMRADERALRGRWVVLVILGGIGRRTQTGDALDSPQIFCAVPYADSRVSRTNTTGRKQHARSTSRSRGAVLPGSRGAVLP